MVAVLIAAPAKKRKVKRARDVERVAGIKKVTVVRDDRDERRTDCHHAAIFEALEMQATRFPFAAKLASFRLLELGQSLCQPRCGHERTSASMDVPFARQNALASEMPSAD
jgi:hypothetical protein